MNYRRPLATATLLLGGFAPALTPAAHADQTVKIGCAVPLTGDLAHMGKDIENGAQLAIDEINKSGLTINGQKVTLSLDAQDDAADPRQGTQVAQKLIDDGVAAVVGHLNSGVSIPASKIYNDAHVTMITPSATNPTLTLQGFNVAYRMVGTDAQQGPALARYAASGLKAKTVAVVDDATSYGQGLAEQFAKTASSAGLTVVSRDATNDKATDFRAILTKIKGERPDVIMYGGMDATAGPFAKQARQLAVSSKMLFGDGACTTDLSKLAGNATDSVYCSEAGIALEKMPGGAAFGQKYQARFGQPVVIYAPFAYDAVYVLVDAMKRANSTSSAAIVGAMQQTKREGVTGLVQFDSHGDLKQSSISIFHYTNGKKQVLDIVKM
ncbi:branched-chain amino acid ABC transporter substrate-binding protein [Burkholderia guangdongensis]|uniref:branched-chain amino acid ABC transporter substrate-binding protein n=1 Tax=Burkholderia guangdongensis TaxID=1792500 RepID=UPI001FE5F05E|nr:branched-chain amino acid ABC transporter substrate-binding protein [Burkholderia guangdongensis]